MHERVGPIYQTYRIAIATWGVDQKKILAGLTDVTTTHAKGGANFREMNLDEAFFKDEGIDLDHPDPHKTTIQLYFSDNTDLLTLEKVFVGENPDMPSKIRTVLKNGTYFSLLHILQYTDLI